MEKKELILTFLTVAAAVLNAYLWREALAGGQFSVPAFYSLPVLALFLLAILFSLSAAFIPGRGLRALTAVLASAGGYLLLPIQPIVPPAAAASALAGWYGASQISSAYQTVSPFRVHQVLRGGLPAFFTGAALLLAVTYLGTLGPKPGDIVPRSLFDAVVPVLEKPLSGVLPGFRANASTDDIILALAAQELGAGADITSLPKAERESLLVQGRRLLSGQLGIELAGTEKGSDLLYRLANGQIKKFLGPYERYLPFVGALAFFIAAKTFTLPIYWVTLLLTAGVVRLLVIGGFLKRETATIQVERLRL